MSVWASLAGPFARITVGPGVSATVFTLPRALLCNSSTYFNAALNNGFAETKEQKVILDDEDPAVFRTYALWLYNSKLETQHSGLQPLDENTAEQYLLHLYIFADKRGITGFANDIITMLITIWAENVMDLSTVIWVCPLISRNSKLYDLILDNMVICLRNESLTRDILDYANVPKDVLVDLLDKEFTPDETFEDFTECCLACICHYHVHTEQEILDGTCVRRLESRCNHFDDDEENEFPEQFDWQW
ncbi:hypothetical protein AUEXF2481DRAFT_30467 [Aureobasidium subglaciale EXF-2481]|uniref:BTB domain-containing protein n=1 Tax=Aureobasidium subglaciale (strain EXF-2481) TaxID=1043005 RepID=A0A074Y9P9_AURSE|nr:uncharacterized protein AUEXF2481DRAFT_30467 [Aureobasidium subglaciale EXF-2481]KAI5209691.1 hypothetical protein E4T38_02377 [Aureobasidium subglaciale]KAI5228571.1 hypothetical protein E4T40_02156 [Aureobasidium subglaciale]KAI5231998.1 hypothetical protein E4T41_02376 [Aureobasidium subglaciale]KAI5265719.1 hypothetical protein E4T46_02154 [Aureobasidium subglaciale]KEQ94495.1 hypothetical protein AUEXF2481DRAFT_30467 [Aureobasidium subglaciale EXF-2481]